MHDVIYLYNAQKKIYGLRGFYELSWRSEASMFDTILKTNNFWSVQIDVFFFLNLMSNEQQLIDRWFFIKFSDVRIESTTKSNLLI